MHDGIDREGRLLDTQGKPAQRLEGRWDKMFFIKNPTVYHFNIIVLFLAIRPLSQTEMTRCMMQGIYTIQVGYWEKMRETEVIIKTKY